MAHAAWLLGIPYTVAVPFSGQESKWPQDARDYYRRIIGLAHEVEIVCEGGYAGWKFTRRDRWMVDHCDLVLALLDDAPRKSGTRITVEYARGRGIEVVNAYDDWLVEVAAG